MIAAPFYGEFGWEVALWAPYLRWMKANVFPNGSFEVVCRVGRGGLYEDFAAVIEVHPPPLSRVDCDYAWHANGGLVSPIEELQRVLKLKRVSRQRVIAPKEMVLSWDPVPTTKRLIYKRLREAERTPGLVAVHVRACAKKQPERNWNETNFRATVEALDVTQLVTVGSPSDSLTHPSAIDLRGSSIRDELDTLARCELIIGPSSGPLHLANQCGVPAVWWSPNAKDVPRYRTVWNPFGCKNERASESWNPSPSAIVDAVRRLREEPPRNVDR